MGSFNKLIKSRSAVHPGNQIPLNLTAIINVMKLPVLQFTAFVLLTVLLLTGCATTASEMADAALEKIGLKKPELPELQKPPRKIKLRMYAAENLNAGNRGKPLSLIVKVYKLKATSSFAQASYDSFLTNAKEKEVLGADVIEGRELTLIPGQSYEFDETVSREGVALAVVALFLSPSGERWKYAFNPADSEQSGITIGLHACAISVVAGSLVVGGASDPKLIASARCN
jgi:type VI secretion system protein VasD